MGSLYGIISFKTPFVTYLTTYGPHFVADIDPFAMYGRGDSHRSSPTGGAAYGMERYSETSAFPGSEELRPVTSPLEVFTVCPTRHSASVSWTESATVTENRSDSIVRRDVGN
jgi:hypothetical protein